MSDHRRGTRNRSGAGTPVRDWWPPVIDAVIDVPWTRQAFAGRPDEFFVQPRAIADEIWHVAHQDRSAWSFNVELRPFGETW